MTYAEMLLVQNTARKLEQEQSPGASFSARLRAAYTMPPDAAIDALRELLKGGEQDA